MQEVRQLEAQASRAGTERDLILGSILICLKQRKLFLHAGYETLWSYLAHKKHIYGFGKRQAERIMRGYSVLQLLQDHIVRPTRERQASDPPLSLLSSLQVPLAHLPHRKYFIAQLIHKAAILKVS